MDKGLEQFQKQFSQSISTAMYLYPIKKASEKLAYISKVLTTLRSNIIKFHTSACDVTCEFLHWP